VNAERDDRYVVGVERRGKCAAARRAASARVAQTRRRDEPGLQDAGAGAIAEAVADAVVYDGV